MTHRDSARHAAALNRTALLAFALAVLAMLMWSGNWVVVRAARTDIPPLGLNFWRWVVATLVLLPFAGAAARRDWPAARRHWRVVLGLGATGAAIFHSMINIGLRSTEAINALLLNLAAPVIIVVMSWAVFRDTVSRRQILGIAISLAGGVVLMAPAYAWETQVAGRPVSLTLPTLGSVAYTGLVASVLAFLCYNAAIARIGPNATGFFLVLMPVFGSVLAIIFLGEKLHLYHLSGFATVLAGIVLATYRITNK